MANEKHLYLTIQGGYKNAPMSAEVWQTGLRLALVFGNVDNIGTLPNNWDVEANPHTDSDTGWTGSTNWTVGGPLLADFDPLDYLSQEVLPAVVTWFGQSTIQAEAYVQNLRLYPIGTDGHAIPAPPFAVGTPAILTTTSNTVIDGTGSGQMLPPQNSIVLSYRTQQVGRRGRGRGFQPAPMATGLAGSNNPTIASGTVTTVANAAAALMAALTTTSDGTSPAVRPIVTGSPWVNYAAITQVRVGNIMDTQRRRRNALVETVTSVDV